MKSHILFHESNCLSPIFKPTSCHFLLNHHLNFIEKDEGKKMRWCTCKMCCVLSCYIRRTNESFIYSNTFSHLSINWKQIATLEFPNFECLHAIHGKICIFFPLKCT